MRHPRGASPALLAAALLLASGAARVHAQSQAQGSPPPASSSGSARLTTTLDAGAASVAYDGFLASGAYTLSPAGRLDLARGSIGARGAATRFPSGNTSWQGILDGSWLVPFAGGLTGELAASGSSTLYDGPDPGPSARNEAGSLLGAARVHLATGRGGGWLGVTAGASTDGLQRRGLVQGEAALWRQLRAATLALAVRPASAEDLRFADVELAGRWWWKARLELGGTVGGRAGDQPGGARTWQELAATWWVGRHLALVAAGGRYPADVLNGVPGARYVAASVRVASRQPARLEEAARPGTAARTTPLALLRALPAGDLELRRLASGETLLRLRAPEAATLELMGDFTDWAPVPMTRAADGMWEARFALAPGTYRFNVRRDGGAWEVPIGVTALPDDLGGTAGIFVAG